jgi:hypothetical protein
MDTGLAGGASHLQLLKLDSRFPARNQHNPKRGRDHFRRGVAIRCRPPGDRFSLSKYNYFI